VYVEEYLLAIVFVCFLRPPTRFLARLFGKPGDADKPPEHKVEEYVLDVGYAVCLGLLTYALVRVSLMVDSHGIPRFLQFLFKTFLDLGLTQAGARTAAHWVQALLVTGIPIAVCIAFSGRTLRFGLSVAAFVFVNALNHIDADDVVYRNRSFFSVHR